MGLTESRAALWTLMFDDGAPLHTEAEWKDVEDVVLRWFVDVKAEESDDTFAEAFRDHRMTVRAILQERHTGHYVPEHVMTRTEMQGNPTGAIKTMQGIPGMRERMTASNFFGDGARARLKYEKGLHDVSAVLLDGRRSLEIGGDANQMYRTSGDTTYIFMPLPQTEDMILSFLLIDRAKASESPGLKVFVAYMKSRLTRIKLAFEGDAGAIFVNFAAAGELQPKVKYGFGNKLSRKSSPEVIHARKLKSQEYTTVLKGNNRNEIIVAYRQHGLLSMQPSTFPMYARGVFVKTTDPNAPLHKGFAIVNEDRQPTGMLLNLEGELFPGQPTDFGANASMEHHSPPKK
jgi:hypothetical protein